MSLLENMVNQLRELKIQSQPEPDQKMGEKRVFNGTCWKCKKKGHRKHECLSGAEKIYKRKG